MKSIKHENAALLKRYFIAAVLEYDGFSGLVIDVPKHIVHSITINKEGVIYIIGKNETGYLAPDSKGRLKYTWNITSGLQDDSV